MKEYFEALLLVIGYLGTIYGTFFAASLGWKHGRGKVNTDVIVNIK